MIYIKTLKQYPLSFKRLEEWVEQKHTTALALLLDKVTNEDCVDFLDQHDVIIDIDPVGHSDYTLKYFCFCVLGKTEYIGRFITRKEATEAAIQKAFELLEQKLKLN